MSPETLSSKQFLSLHYVTMLFYIASFNTETANNVPIVTLTSTPMPSTSKAESVCPDEPRLSISFPNDMSVINTGSNTSTLHSSPQKGLAGMYFMLY